MKLDLILENIRNRYSLGLLEESEGMSEKDILKGKILINESTMKIRKMLIEEGTMAQVAANLEEAWTAALIQEDMDAIEAAYDSAKEYVAPGVEAVKNYGINALGGNTDAQMASAVQASQPTGLAGQAANAVQAVQGKVADAGQAVNSGIDQASQAVNSGIAQAGQAVNSYRDQAGQAIDAGVEAAKDGLLTPGQAAAGLGVAGAGLAMAGGRGAAAVDGVKYGYANPKQSSIGGFSAAKRSGLRTGQAINRLAGMVRR